MVRYRDRIEAGRHLAGFLQHLRGDEPFVLGIPRGGVVVAAEVASELQGQLGVVPARKVGSPMSAELAIGAVAPGGITLIDHDMVERLGVTSAELDDVVRRSEAELDQRSHRYGVDLPPDVRDRVAIVVDDGVATGATLRAVLAYVRSLEPRLLVCAVPVGPPATIDLLASEADEVVCPAQPDRFRSVGEWYRDFSQTTDEEVMALLA